MWCCWIFRVREFGNQPGGIVSALSPFATNNSNIADWPDRIDYADIVAIAVPTSPTRLSKFVTRIPKTNTAPPTHPRVQSRLWKCLSELNQSLV
jgi:hypothetical protein